MRKHIYIVQVLGILFLSTLTFGQSQDSTLAMMYFNRSLQFYNVGQFDSMATTMTKASYHFERDSNWNWSISCDNAVYFALQRIGNFLDAAPYAINTLERAERHLPLDSRTRWDAINNVATHYLNKSEFLKSFDYLNQCLTMYRDGCQIDSVSLSTLYQNLGINYYEFGDYIRSIQHHNNAIALCKNIKGCASTYKHASELYNISLPLYEMDSFARAKECLTNVISLDRGKWSDPLLLISSHLKLSQVELKIGQFELAISRLQKLINIQQKNQGFRLDRTFKILSELYAAQGNFENSIFYAKEQLEYTNVDKGLTDYLSLAEAYSYYAKVLAENRDLNLSELMYAKSFEALLEDKFEFNDEYWPHLLESNASGFALEIIKDYLSFIVFPKKDFDRHKIVFNSVIPYLEHNAMSYIQKDGSKLQFNRKIASQYSFFIDWLLSHYESSNDVQLLKQAMLYSLRLKNSILRQDLVELEFEKSIRGTNPMMMQMASIKREISDIKQKIRKGDGLVDNHERKLFLLNEEIQMVKDSMQNTQPVLYAQLNRTFDLHTIDDLQQFLSRTGSSQLDFFQSDSAIYVFHLTGNSIDFHRIPFTTDLRETFERVRHVTSDPNVIAMGENSLDQMSDDLHHLYRTLIEPIHQRAQIAETVYINPDGYLNSIPLDILSTTECISCRSFHDIDYMVKSHTIAYLVSPDDLLLERKTINDPQASFFAPTYGSKSSLATLEFVENEFEALNEICETMKYAGDHVSTNLFKKSVASSNIIHLSTHAVADVQNPANSIIYFSPVDSSSGETSKLYPEDFSALNLDADLVVLSACETGKGKLYSGEGVYSFSRYFMSAGAQSVIHNLWKADDLSTSTIVSAFYSNLSNGESKSSALRKAKLSYLENTDDYGAHPYFWSTLLAIGNPDPMFHPYGNRWLYIAFGLLVLAAVLFYFRRRMT